MEYKRKLKIDKDFLGIYAINLIIYAIAVACFIAGSGFIGLLLLVVGIYISWLIFKTTKQMLSTKIVTYTDGFTVYNTDGSTREFPWDSITLARKIEDGKFKDNIFVYAEAQDKYVKLPTVFHDFDQFTEELSQHIEIIPCTLNENESISDYLKRIVLGEENSTPSEAEKTEEAKNAETESV